MAKSVKKKSLESSLKQLHDLLEHFPENSGATQRDRRHHLSLAVKQLSDGGYKIANLNRLENKHSDFLRDLWAKEEISAGVIKNRMCNLRWLAEKLNIKKSGFGQKSNRELAIPNRIYTDNSKNKAQKLDYEKVNQIKHPELRLTLELCAEFGLRRKEALRFQIKHADQGDHLMIKDVWTKGGRPRVIPVTTESQRDLLNRIWQYTKEHKMQSMIPVGTTYKQQKNKLQNEQYRVGIKNIHGLRHQYAQDRYKTLLGYDCPKVDKNTRKFNMTKEEIAQEKEVRLIISEELGHSRINITNAYLGSIYRA